MCKGYVALLKIFDTLKQRVTLLDKIIKHNAMVTHNCYKNSVMLSTIEQVEKITKLIAVRNAVEHLHNSIVDAINKLDKQQRLLLILLYIRNADKQKICEHFGFSMRTLYRRANGATQQFEHTLKSMGIDRQWLVNNVKDFLLGKLKLR